MNKIIDGKMLAKEIETKLKLSFSKQKQKKLCFILVGENTASEKFIEVKSRIGARVGVITDTIRLPEESTTDDVVQVISDASKIYDGIVVQLPLPEHLDQGKILNSIPSNLDVDVLSSESIQNFIKNQSDKLPPVAGAVKIIFDSLSITPDNPKYKNILLLGHGKLVGEPVSLMLEKFDFKHLVVDVSTPQQERENYIKHADIIISGIGVPHFIQPHMLKVGVICIDAGTSEDKNKLSNTLMGDFDPPCIDVASYITPVPGGIGPLTVVSLFQNLL